MSKMVAGEVLARTGAETLGEAIEGLASKYLMEADCRSLPVDLSRLTKCLRIASVTVGDLPCDGLLIPKSKDSYQVRISSRASAERQRFSLAHECGHVILHHLIPETRSIATRTLFRQVGSDVEERFCDALAGSLLMPRREFLEDVGANFITPESICFLATKYRVSLGAAMIRARQILNGPDLALILFSTTEQSQGRYGAKILANFRNGKLRVLRSELYSHSCLVSRSLTSDFKVSGWDWFRQGVQKRRLFMRFGARRPTSSGYSCLALLAREPVGDVSGYGS